MESLREIDIDGISFVYALDLAKLYKQKNTTQFCRTHFADSYIKKDKSLLIRKSDVEQYLAKTPSNVPLDDHQLSVEKRLESMKQEVKDLQRQYEANLDKLKEEVEELRRIYNVRTRAFVYHRNILMELYKWITKKLPSLSEEETPTFPWYMDIVLENIKNRERG